MKPCQWICENCPKRLAVKTDGGNDFFKMVWKGGECMMLPEMDLADWNRGGRGLEIKYAN